MTNIYIYIYIYIKLRTFFRTHSILIHNHEYECNYNK